MRWENQGWYPNEGMSLQSCCCCGPSGEVSFWRSWGIDELGVRVCASAKLATTLWSSPLVAMIARARAFMCGMESRLDGVSVGWQWASKTPRCQGKASAGFSSGDGLRIASSHEISSVIVE